MANMKVAVLGWIERIGQVSMLQMILESFKHSCELIFLSMLFPTMVKGQLQSLSTRLGSSLPDTFVRPGSCSLIPFDTVCSLFF
jgi:hypothetical protein